MSKSKFIFISRVIYYTALGLFVFSYFLPATEMFNERVNGYDCALIVLSGLFEWRGFGEFLLHTFLNLSNIATVIVFLAHFKIKLEKLLLLQVVGFASACYWPLSLIYSNAGLDGLFIGFWTWFLSLFTITLCMTALYLNNKRSVKAS